APTEGYGEAIVILKILAENFEIKTNLFQLGQANKFHGRENDNPHTHISNFKRMTATLKYRDVSNDAIKLMLFPYSLEDKARIWDVVSKSDDQIDKLADQILNLVEIVNKQVIAPAKGVEKTCVTCGGAHAYYNCIATDSNQPSVCAATGSYNQVSSPNRVSHQIPPPGFALVQNNPNRFNQNQEPPNSILTWDDLVNKFVNQFFPPSKTTHLKNEISRFTQRFEETFGEAWDRFKEMLRACPHHRFSELTQIDTFYNGLTEQDQDSLNVDAGGNLLNKTTREALKVIENKSKVRYSRSKSNVSKVNTNSRDVVSKTDDRFDKLADQISNLVEIVNKQVIAPAKAVEKTCVTYGGAHPYYDCIATDSNQPSVCVATGSYN
nr:reverse transcriptase domain-containing protein [Tanacetum cinerariifolium]